MSKCLPILDQMPPEIMEKIVGYTDDIDKFRLRQCCKYFKQIVDKSEIDFDDLSFCYSENWANVCVRFPGRHTIDKTFNGENPENAMAALNFLENVLKSHPKIYVIDMLFQVRFETRQLEKHRELVVEKLSQIFSGLESKLQVETLTIQSFQDEQLLMSVLPHLVPGTLRELNLNNTFTPNISIDLSRTFETEQWKQADVLTVAHNCLAFDLEKTDHFETVDYKVAILEVEYVKGIIENFRRPENVEKWRIIHPDQYDFDAIKQSLSQFDHKIVRNDDDVLTMIICRDGYGCEIDLDRRLNRMVFEGVGE